MGLRHGSRLLYVALGSFLDQCVVARAVHERDNRDDREMWWKAIGIDEDSLDDFVELDPVWTGTVLQVYYQEPMSSKTLDTLKALITYPGVGGDTTAPGG